MKKMDLGLSKAIMYLKDNGVKDLKVGQENLFFKMEENIKDNS